MLRKSFIAVALLCVVQISLAQVHNVKYDSNSGTFDSSVVSLVEATSLIIGGDDGDKIVVTGNGFKLDGDLEIVLAANVQVVLDFEIDIGGNLSVRSAKEDFISWEDDAVGGLSTEIDTLVFSGVRLSDYKLQSSNFTQGNGISGLAPIPFFLVDNGNEQTAQFQRLDDVFTKCVKVRVFQGEDGVYARKMYGKYITGNHYRKDFDDLAGVTRYDGYRMRQLTLSLKVEESLRSVRFAKVLAIDGNIAVSNGVYAVCEKISGLLDEDGCFGKEVAINNGTFIFDTPEKSFSFGGRLSGIYGTVGVVVRQDGEISEEEYSYVHEGTLEYSDGWQRVFEGVSLADVTKISAYGTGGSLYPVAKYANVPLDWQFAVNDGYRASCEFQLIAGSGAHFKAIGYLFKQVGSDIYACHKYSGYLNIKDCPGVENPGDWHFSSMGYATGAAGNGLATKGGYAVSNLTVCVKRQAGEFRQVQVELLCTNAMTHSDFLLLGGSRVGVNAKALSSIHCGFPASGTMTVRNGALLELDVNDVQDGLYGNNTRLIVEQGGTVYQHDDWQFSQNSSVEIIGGSLALKPDRWVAGAIKPDWGDSGTYVGKLIYSNGGRSRCSVVRMGMNNYTPTIKATGSLSSRADHDICVVGYYNTTLVFDIEDVTSNSGTDFTLSGKIVPFSDNHENFAVVKTGNGTLELLGANNCSQKPTRVERGVLRLGTSGAMHENMALALAGGSFTVAANTVNTLGTLNVSTNATLMVESGSNLSFADSSSVVWNAGQSKVTVVKGVGARLRFGTSDKGLSEDQLKVFRIDGRRCRLDADGYLEPKFGTVIVVR